MKRSPANIGKFPDRLRGGHDRHSFSSEVVYPGILPTTDWLTDTAREKLRANGIAPPVKAAGKRALFSSETIACPKCGSADTEQISAFGSTPCKAHHRCRACREPFEYFKCI